MSRRLYVLVLAFTLVFTSVGTYSPAQAQYLTCKDCASVFQGGQTLFFCETQLLIGFQDCFGPMLPYLPCSVWGPWTICFLHEGSQNEEVSLSLDGTLNHRNVARSDLLRLAAMREQSLSRPPAEGDSRSLRTCTGLVLQRSFGATIGSSLRALSQRIVL